MDAPEPPEFHEYSQSNGIIGKLMLRLRLIVNRHTLSTSRLHGQVLPLRPRVPNQAQIINDGESRLTTFYLRQKDKVHEPNPRLDSFNGERMAASFFHIEQSGD